MKEREVAVSTPEKPGTAKKESDKSLIDAAKTSSNEEELTRKEIKNPSKPLKSLSNTIKFKRVPIFLISTQEFRGQTPQTGLNMALKIFLHIKWLKPDWS